MGRRDITIRWSLLRNLLLLIVVLSGSILTVTVMIGKETVRRLSRDLVDHMADRTEAELGRFFEPVAAQLQIAAERASQGLLVCRDPACVNTLLPPVMRQVPQVSSVNTGDGHGGGVLLLRDADGTWRNREVRRDAWGPKVRWTRLDAHLETISHWEEALDYDPRLRPWYTGAVGAASASIHWTAPYTFKTTKDPGITASIQIQPPDELPFVLAYDVLLKDVSHFTSRLEVSEHGFAFVLAEDGRVVGLPRDARWEDPAAFQAAILADPQTLGLPSLAQLATRAGHSADTAQSIVEMDVDGESWWGVRRPFRLEGGPTLSIGVAVPETDFLGDVERQRTLILALTAVALLSGVLLSVWLARRYGRPLEALARQSERIADLDMEATSRAPSNLREIRRLGDAQDRMRSALDSFARYVPTDVVRDLLRRGEAAQIGGRTEVLTILFTDIAGFTTISEGLEPSALTAHMAEYFDAMLSTLREHGATIDKLIGDAIVAFWGAPNPVEEHPRRAAEAILACCERLDALNAAWIAEGKAALPTRFGLATGSVVVGNVGTAKRLHYTVLGDSVNLASRLEGANKIYGTRVLAEGRAVREAGETFLWRRVDRVAVKGRTGAVDVFTLLGKRGTLDREVVRAAAHYETALARYQSGHFDEALGLLQEEGFSLRDDADVQRLVHLCRQYRKTPPPPDWDGAGHLGVK